MKKLTNCEDKKMVPRLLGSLIAIVSLCIILLMFFVEKSISPIFSTSVWVMLLIGSLYMFFPKKTTAKNKKIDLITVPIIVLLEIIIFLIIIR